MKYHFKVHKEGSGFWAECMELSGCLTQGDSMEELRKNMQEALNLYIDEPSNSKKLAALPDDSIVPSRNVVEVQVDPSIAFAFMVRYSRIKHGMTQQEAAKKLGFVGLYSYQRLENKKCNPTLKVLYKIKKAFPDFSVDFALSC
ncbi:MAG: type II toxin-antitoxin system HicB family antitoxin [Parachlamydia sp.]|nr:type II toxin-antitoxin system HicB family antitoxin [Parachlamydia sp.]